MFDFDKPWNDTDVQNWDRLIAKVICGKENFEFSAGPQSMIP